AIARGQRVALLPELTQYQRLARSQLLTCIELTAATGRAIALQTVFALLGQRLVRIGVVLRAAQRLRQHQRCRKRARAAQAEMNTRRGQALLFSLAAGAKQARPVA